MKGSPRNSGRVVALLLAVLVLGIGLGVFAIFQSSLRQRAELAELETKQHLDEARSAATQRAADPVEDPTTSSEPTPPAEARTAAQRTELDAKEVEVQVLDASNAPVAQTTVILFLADKVLAEAATLADGVAQFPALDGTGEYVIALRDREPVRGELALAAGLRTVVRLEEGVYVAGTVLVDGTAPSEPLELSWNLNDRTRGIYGLPAAVSKAVSRARGNRYATVVRTNPDGSFAFPGLAPDAAGTIRWTKPYFIEGSTREFDARRVAVPAPRSDLLLHLVAGLELRLRVVDPSGVALPGASVSWERATKNSTTSSSTNADSEGRFVQAIAPDPFDKLSVSVAASAGGGENSYEFVPPQVMRGVWDLGDLATRATRKIGVLVVDADGEPVKHAQVMPWPASQRGSNDRTDAAGRMTLSVDSGETQIAVVAFEYLSTRVAVPKDATEVTAKLTSACVLECEVAGSSAGGEGLVVELEGPSPLFLGEDIEGPDTLRTVSGSWNSSVTDGTATFETDAEKTGLWRIAGLTPHQPLRARLKGAGKTFSEVEVDPLAQGEHRRIVLTLDEVGKPLHVRVLSPDGRPASTAHVYVMHAENASGYRGHSVDAKGEVEFKSLYGDRCTLFAQADGYAPKWLTLNPIPAGTIEVTLEPGHSIEIELVRGDGSIFLEEARVRVDSDGPRFQRATSTGPGRYRLDGLPAAEVLLQVNGAFRSVSRLHDCSVPFVRIAVGGSGSIRATLRGVGVADEDLWSVAVAAPGSAQDLTRVPFYSREEDLRAAVYGLFEGPYDVWLERRSENSMHEWVRVGQPTSALIDAEHPNVEVELRPPN